MALKNAIALFVVMFILLQRTISAGCNLSYEIESVGRLQVSGLTDADAWCEISKGVLEIPACVDGCPVVRVKGRACISNQTIMSVRFGHMLQTIGNMAFANCSNLTEVSFAESGPDEGRQVRISAFAFANTSNLRDVKFPNALVSIGSDAFMGCDNLASVVLPLGVVMVADGAFSHCSSLESVCIPSTVEMMDDAFSIFTPNLRIIDLSEDNPYYCKEDDAIYSRKRHELVLYPRVTTNKVAKIKDGTEWVRGFSFFQCKGIESVDFPATISVICEGAFGCSTLKNVDLPAHLTTISDRAFAECTNLTEVAFCSQVRYIGENAFGGCHELKRIVSYAQPFDSELDKLFPSNAVFFVYGYYDEWGHYSATTGRRVEFVKECN